MSGDGVAVAGGSVGVVGVVGKSSHSCTPEQAAHVMGLAANFIFDAISPYLAHLFA
jgi:hypothetical protein